MTELGHKPWKTLKVTQSWFAKPTQHSECVSGCSWITRACKKTSPGFTHNCNISHSSHLPGFFSVTASHANGLIWQTSAFRSKSRSERGRVKFCMWWSCLSSVVPHMLVKETHKHFPAQNVCLGHHRQNEGRSAKRYNMFQIIWYLRLFVRFHLPESCGCPKNITLHLRDLKKRRRAARSSLKSWIARV